MNIKTFSLFLIPNSGYLNEMWLCNSALLKKEYFDVKSMSWQIGTELQGKLEDPLQDPVVMMSVTEQQKYLLQLHEDIDNQCGASNCLEQYIYGATL
ncbi:hypothetical protein [Arsenophonus sp. PmNCSU2021_1]|uniref:hypothetical protein n=1 Tax=Arsenophonus sp. PmNCSU2021_1 TaxID=3118989 RepID=UPI002FF31148